VFQVHIYPNVRLLVYGRLIARGTRWQPIRFLPYNTSEMNDDISFKTRRDRRDVVSLDLPVLYRQDSAFQHFDVYLVQGAHDGSSGWLHIYNRTSGSVNIGVMCHKYTMMQVNRCQFVIVTSRVAMRRWCADS
jgi:hypothetical protein